MTKYVVLIPGNEDTWDATPQEDKERVYLAGYKRLYGLLPDGG